MCEQSEDFLGMYTSQRKKKERKTDTVLVQVKLEFLR